MLGGINHKPIYNYLGFLDLTGTHYMPTTYPIPMNPEEKAQTSSIWIGTRGRCSKQRTSHTDMSSPRWHRNPKILRPYIVRSSSYKTFVQLRSLVYIEKGAIKLQWIWMRKTPDVHPSTHIHPSWMNLVGVDPAGWKGSADRIAGTMPPACCMELSVRIRAWIGLRRDGVKVKLPKGRIVTIHATNVGNLCAHRFQIEARRMSRSLCWQVAESLESRGGREVYEDEEFATSRQFWLGIPLLTSWCISHVTASGKEISED